MNTIRPSITRHGDDRLGLSPRRARGRARCRSPTRTSGSGATPRARLREHRQRHGSRRTSRRTPTWARRSRSPSPRATPRARRDAPRDADGPDHAGHATRRRPPGREHAQSRRSRAPSRAASVLTAPVGTWSGTTPMTFSYQWQRCPRTRHACTAIAGATRSTYTLVAADVGRRIRLQVTAANGAGSASATSAIPKVVTATAPAAIRQINGNARANRLTGTARAERIDGKGGNDRIDGKGGKDVLIGGTGNDTIMAADGIAETINCGAGRDRVTADRTDKLSGCERVTRRTAARRRWPDPAVAEAVDGVVVDEPGRLHQRVEHRRPDEAEAAPLQLLRHRLRLRRLGRDLAHRAPRVHALLAADEAPEERVEEPARRASSTARAFATVDSILRRLRTMPGSRERAARRRARRTAPPARRRTPRTPCGSPRACAGSSTTRAPPGRPRA